MRVVNAGDEQSGCGVVDTDEGEDEPGCVLRGQFLVQHDLLGH